MSKTVAELPREEWAMFNDCPEEQQPLSFFYEYARELTAIVEAVRRYKLPSTPHYNDAEGFGWDCGIGSYLALVLYSELDCFPETPWLSLPDERRKSSISLTNAKQHLTVSDWEAQNREGYGPCTGSSDNLKLPKIRDGKVIEVYFSKVDHIENNSPVDYFVHRVNWDKSDNVLVAEFREWLEAWRPLSPHETRGKTTPRDQLKVLGALRLLRHYHGDWNEAYIQTAKVLSKPLYTHQAHWIDARKKANQYLRAFEKAHIRPLR